MHVLICMQVVDEDDEDDAGGADEDTRAHLDVRTQVRQQGCTPLDSLCAPFCRCLLFKCVAASRHQG